MSIIQQLKKVGVKHQFCMFHTKQKINRNIREDKKRNNYSNEELEYLNYCKQLVFDVLNANNLESAKKVEIILLVYKTICRKLFLIYCGFSSFLTLKQ